MEMTKPARAATARQLVLTERAISALPPMKPVVRGRANRSSVPRPPHQVIDHDIDAFPSAEERSVANHRMARRLALPTCYVSAQHEDFQLDSDVAKLFRPVGTPGRYCRRPGLFGSYADNCILSKVDVFPKDPFAVRLAAKAAP